jgi:hypothetical protein
MSRKLIGRGVVALALCVAAGSAQAKLIRYEIDGKRYSYSTNNIQQTREARRRIDAANAAAAAKTRADAELAANPISRIFGSRTQREAAEAQARLQQTIAPGASPSVAPQADADFESTSSVRKSRTETRRAKKAVEARAERRQALREARRERRQKVASARAQRRASLSVATDRAEIRKELPRRVEARHRMEPAPSVPLVERVNVGGDQSSRNSSPQSSPSEPAGNSLMDFVNQVRKALP